MKRTLILVSAFATVLGFCTHARAGIADSPLPVLIVGEKTLHLYSVPGAINFVGLGTFFSCTSTDTTAMEVGVEVFGTSGGAPLNDAAATSINLIPGATATFGTAVAAGIHTNATLGSGIVTKGSARILSTSKKLACTAYIADIGNSPPTSMAPLSIIKKTTQKAAN